jgi:hypothetical protein
MRLVWAVLLVFAGRFLVTAIWYPAGDGDLGWQRWLGGEILRTHAIPRALGAETFTATGAAWLPQEWLFGIFATLAHPGIGFALFGAFAAACAVGALALTALRALRRGASPIASAIVVACAGVGLVESFGVRAQVVAWPLLALFLLLLDTESPWMWMAVPVAALWSNFHASAMLAPVLAACATLGVALEERRWNDRVRRSLLLTAACSLAICCNPFGIELPRYAAMLFGSPIKHYINEWKITGLGDTSFALGALPLLVGAVVFGIGARERRWKDVVVFLAFGYLLLSAARNIALFGLAAAPLVAVGLSRALPRAVSAPATRLARLGKLGITAFSVVLSAVVAFSLVRSAPTEAGRKLPTGALAMVERTGMHRLFCADFAWCSLVLPPDGGEPRVRTFLDGRADPFPFVVWSDFVGIVRLSPGWRAKLDTHGVDAVLVALDAPLGQALALTPEWRSAYHDAGFRLYVRRAPLRTPAPVARTCRVPAAIARLPSAKCSPS